MLYSRSSSDELRIADCGVGDERGAPCWLTAGSRNPQSAIVSVPRTQIVLLLVGQGVDLDPHRVQLQAGDLVIDFDWHVDDVIAEFLAVLDQVFRGERLVGE